MLTHGTYESEIILNFGWAKITHKVGSLKRVIDNSLLAIKIGLKK